MNNFFCPQLGRDMATIACRYSRQRNAEPCASCEGWQEWQEKYKEGVDMTKRGNERNYTKGKTCEKCGKPVCNNNSSGLCIDCYMVPQIEPAEPETVPVECESIDAMPVTPTTYTDGTADQPTPDPDILAIESVLIDARKWREIEPLVSEILAVSKRLQEVMS